MARTRTRSASRESIQAKLAVSQPEDESEREADHVAEQVMRKPDPGRDALQRAEDEDSSETPEETMVQRECSDCANDDEPDEIQTKSLHRAASASTGMRPSPGFSRDLGKARAAGGAPLPGDVRNFMEPRFGESFRHVRIHTDEKAHSLSRSIRARAFTTGEDVFFAKNEFKPGVASGRQLIAHELTHVVQQNGAGVAPKSIQRQPADAPGPGADAEPLQKLLAVPWRGSVQSSIFEFMKILAKDSDQAAHITDLIMEQIRFTLNGAPATEEEYSKFAKEKGLIALGPNVMALIKRHLGVDAEALGRVETEAEIRALFADLKFEPGQRFGPPQEGSEPRKAPPDLEKEEAWRNLPESDKQILLELEELGMAGREEKVRALSVDARMAIALKVGDKSGLGEFAAEAERFFTLPNIMALVGMVALFSVLSTAAAADPTKISAFILGAVSLALIVRFGWDLIKRVAGAFMDLKAEAKAANNVAELGKAGDKYYSTIGPAGFQFLLALLLKKAGGRARAPTTVTATTASSRIQMLLANQLRARILAAFLRGAGNVLPRSGFGGAPVRQPAAIVQTIGRAKGTPATATAAAPAPAPARAQAPAQAQAPSVSTPSAVTAPRPAGPLTGPISPAATGFALMQLLQAADELRAKADLAEQQGKPDEAEKLRTEEVAALTKAADAADLAAAQAPSAAAVTTTGPTEAPDPALAEKIARSAPLTIAEARRLPAPHRGVIFVFESSGRSTAADEFESGVSGGAQDIASKNRIVPALRFDNPDKAGNNFIKFDGFRGDVLIDRKLNITTFPKQLGALRRMDEALKQNKDSGINAVVEVPTEAAKRAVEKAMVKAGVPGAVDVVVVPQPDK